VAADDCGSTQATACVWSNLAQTKAGVFNSPGESDLFALTPTVSGLWTFQNTTTTATVMGGLSDADGNLLGSSASGQLPFTFTASLTAGQTYYLSVIETANASGTKTLGAYTLRASGPVTPTLSVSPSSVTVPAAGAGIVQGFNLGSTIPLTITSNSAWTLSTDGPVFVSDSVVGLTSSYSGSGSATLRLAVTTNSFTTARTMHVTVTSVNAPSVFRTVTLTQPAVAADDCGSTQATACVWSNLAQTKAGVFNSPGETDMFKITPTTTGVWTFQNTTTTATVMGYLYAADGTYLASSTSGQLPFTFTASLTAGQTYYLSVIETGNPNGDQPLGNYTLKATAP
jgi:hypothetical protein